MDRGATYLTMFDPDDTGTPLEGVATTAVVAPPPPPRSRRKGPQRQHKPVPRVVNEYLGVCPWTKEPCGCQLACVKGFR